MTIKRLQGTTVSIGSWLTIGHPAVAEILCNCGFDWLVIDLEHTTIGMDKCGELIRIIDLCGSLPLVRLTSNDLNQIKRVMDAGAHGVIVPSVNSVADAEAAVSATRYHPQGTRGVGLGRAQKYGVEFRKYFEWQKSEPIVLVQIEHISAVDQVEEIFSDDGVDGFIIGPYDLSCSMGIPGQFEHAEFLATIEKIRKAGNKMKCHPGIHVVEPDPEDLNKAIKAGYQLIAYGVDMRMLDVCARNGINCFKDFTK